MDIGILYLWGGCIQTITEEGPNPDRSNQWAYSGEEIFTEVCTERSVIENKIGITIRKIGRWKGTALISII